MNYNEFMTAVDNRLSAMSETEKTEWIHNLARTKKENERIAFLNSLDEKQDYPASADREWIEDWCNKVENEEIYFECSGYEEYGESYWDSDFVYDYYDIFEIGKDLSNAFQVAEDMLFQKEYKQALGLYDRLCSMTFKVLDRDTEEWDDLALEDVAEEELVDLDLKQIALHLMYTKYLLTEGEERTAALYQYLTWNMCKNIKVEEIFTVGPEELEGIGFFTEEWISFLKNIEGDRAGKFLLEACIFQGGISRLCETAREVSARHPVLYKYACELLLKNNKEPESEILGLEAIRTLPENLRIRAEIAELTAKAAEQLEHPDIIKECYEAAFYADSTVNNYLRLFELPDYQNIVEKAAKYAKILPENSIRGLNNNMKQLTVNRLSMEHKKIIRFFNGEFDYVYEDCKNDKTTLGWSGCFKGIAIPLFILFLDKNKKITKAGQQLINGIAYRLGFIEEGNMESFLDLFLNWKEKVVLTNEQYEKYIGSLVLH